MGPVLRGPAAAVKEEGCRGHSLRAKDRMGAWALGGCFQPTLHMPALLHSACPRDPSGRKRQGHHQLPWPGFVRNKSLKT